MLRLSCLSAFRPTQCQPPEKSKFGRSTARRGRGKVFGGGIGLYREYLRHERQRFRQRGRRGESRAEKRELLLRIGLCDLG